MHLLNDNGFRNANVIEVRIYELYYINSFMQCTIMGHPRYLDAVHETYDLFEESDIVVLSPRKSDIEDMAAYIRLDMASKETQKAGQLSVAAQNLFEALLENIRKSDFIYVVNLHNSFDDMQTFAAGYAHALGKYMFSSCRVENPPAGNYVKIFSPHEAIEFLRAGRQI